MALRHLNLMNLPKGVEAYPCDCGGYCDLVSSTEDECRNFGCGFDRPGHECCARSFVCRICGSRYAGSSESPEMEE